MDIHQQLAANHNRRLANEARFIERIEKRELSATAMIGELCRQGVSVFYVSPQGGKYREGTRVELISFLIRNNYA